MSRNASANPVRGNAIFARTEQLAALVTLPPVPWFRGRRQSPGTSRLEHNRRLRATTARTDASAATWQAPLARFAGALHTAIKKGRGAHTFSCGRRCPAGADEGMRCAPWPANCPHPAVPARPRKRGSPRSPREKERRLRRAGAACDPAIALDDVVAWLLEWLAMTSSAWPGQPTPSAVCWTTS